MNASGAGWKFLERSVHFLNASDSTNRYSRLFLKMAEAEARLKTMSRKAREARAQGVCCSHMTERKTEAQHSGSRF